MASIATIKSLTPDAFQTLGIEEVAYIRASIVNGEPAFTVHRADGIPVFAAPELQVATAAILNNNLHPVSVH